MGRGDVLPIKGLVGKALSLISLFLTKGSGDGGIKGIVNVVNASSGAFIERVLVRI